MFQRSWNKIKKKKPSPSFYADLWQAILSNSNFRVGLIRQSSGSCQAVIMPLSGCHQAIVRQSLGSHQAVSHQAVVRQFSGSCQAVVRQLSGSCQADVRQSSGSRQATKFSDSLTLFQPCVCGGGGQILHWWFTPFVCKQCVLLDNPFKQCASILNTYLVGMLCIRYTCFLNWHCHLTIFSSLTQEKMRISVLQQQLSRPLLLPT